MKYRLRTYKAFTLIELIVAIGILAVVLSFASVIFRVSIDAHRTAIANAEIMQKLRAITNQFDDDFKGLRKDAPLFIWFQQDPNNPDQRYDQVMFFADGDFQSIQLYDYGKDPNAAPSFPLVEGPQGSVRGNIARINYGQARVYAPTVGSFIYPWDQIGQDRSEPMLNRQDRILSRCRHILTSDPRLDIWPDPNNIAQTFDTSFRNYRKNDLYEHDSLSLAQWKMVDRAAYENPILDVCFDSRTFFDIGDPNTFQRLMCKGNSNFSIQWAYWDPAYAKFHWFPSNDPDGDSNPADSHFGLMSSLPIQPIPVYTNFYAFGTFFNIPTNQQINYWGPVSLMRYNSAANFPADFYPKAIKFTFTLYDSKGIVKNGRVFTHIVYLGD